jgi:hypothetical protein
MTDPDMYEARYGWNRQSLKVIGIGLAFCAVAPFIGLPLWVQVLTITLFGGGNLLVILASLRKPVALRVDAAGVTTRPQALSKRTFFCPWEDAETILIWQFQRIRTVGVVRRLGAAPPAVSPKRVSIVALRITALGIPPEVAATGAPASGRVLDLDRLTRPVARYGPHVQVIDTTQGKVLHPSASATEPSASEPRATEFGH